MYQVSVPVCLNDNMDKETLLKSLKSVNADYVFLAIDIHSVNQCKNQLYISKLKQLIPFFKSHGINVGIWFWTFWLHDLDENYNFEDYLMVKYDGSYRKNIHPLSSHEEIISGTICPTSEKGTKIQLEFIKELASLSPDMILFDDDFEFATHQDGMGCYCKRHLQLASERLGYKITREELLKQVIADKPNDVRRMWYYLMGETLENYAKAVRDAVDSVNPNIRIGHCSVWSDWGTDGTSSERLAKLLAGNTKPFIRSIGAPYWAVNRNYGNRLQHVIELNRMEFSFLEDKDIDFFIEGDVYPRPRHAVPASYLEIFNTALRAARVGNGIHKYMLDYTSKHDYETGYLERHIKNQELYGEIENVFGDKRSVGVRVYEFPNKIVDTDFSNVDDRNGHIKYNFFSIASRMLSDNSIPTTYEQSDTVGIAFGENARHLTDEDMKNGLILDVRAARILMEMGIDVGIEKIGENVFCNLLYFPEFNDEVVSGYAAKSAYELTLKENAEIVVYGKINGKQYPDAFHYENKNGQRFLVYAFDSLFSGGTPITGETRYRNYLTQKQLISSIEWLQKKSLPATCIGNPDLYMLCTANESGMAIGLWNIFADDILHPEIILDKKYSDAEFINCSGTLEGNIIKLQPISPYSFAFINLKL